MIRKDIYRSLLLPHKFSDVFRCLTLELASHLSWHRICVYLRWHPPGLVSHPSWPQFSRKKTESALRLSWHRTWPGRSFQGRILGWPYTEYYELVDSLTSTMYYGLRRFRGGTYLYSGNFCILPLSNQRDPHTIRDTHVRLKWKNLIHGDTAYIEFRGAPHPICPAQGILVWVLAFPKAFPVFPRNGSYWETTYLNPSILNPLWIDFDKERHELALVAKRPSWHF